MRSDKAFICNLDDNLLCLGLFLGIDRFDAVFLLLEAVDDAFFSACDTESDSFLFLSLWLLTERIGTEPYSQSRYNSNRSLFFILDLLL